MIDCEKERKLLKKDLQKEFGEDFVAEVEENLDKYGGEEFNE